MCPHDQRPVPPPGAILLWGEGVPLSYLLPPVPPMTRVMGKTFGSSWIVTTLTGVAFDQVFACLCYNLLYLAIFQLLRDSILTSFYWEESQDG
jgi:hypothetical protein